MISHPQICIAKGGGGRIHCQQCRRGPWTEASWLQARERNLSAVKLSKKDERELRDLMPTDENLLETCELHLRNDCPC